MESLLEAIIEPLPWILILVFGLFAIFVKEVRVTSSVILLGSLIVASLQGVFEEGTTITYLYKGVIDVVTGLTLLLCYGYWEAKKAPEQAVIFILFSFSHAWLMYEVFAKTYWFYDYYDGVMVGLTVAHFLVMGDYYEELYKNIKKTLAVRVFNRSLAFSSNDMDSDGQPRGDVVDSSSGRGVMGPFRSGTYAKKASGKKEGASNNGS